jgi:hypothetical protein
MLRVLGIYREEANYPVGDPGAHDNQEERGEVLNNEKARLVLKRENA